MPAYAIETQSLIGPQVVNKLQAAIVERDVSGGIVQPAAGEVAQVALARGSQPRPFSRLSQLPFPQQLRVSESDGSSEDWRRTAAIASLQVECSSDCVAIFFGVGCREQLDVLKGIAGKNAQCRAFGDIGAVKWCRDKDPINVNTGTVEGRPH